MERINMNLKHENRPEYSWIDSMLVLSYNTRGGPCQHGFNVMR